MRRRFGGRRTAGGVVTSNTFAKKRGKCRGCQSPFAVGDAVVRLRLKKHLRAPCGTCGHKLVGIKWYHPTCMPLDVNAAMGFDPTAHQPLPTPKATGGSVAPPPTPPSSEDAALAALAALENALLMRLARMTITDELETKFKTLQGIKARALSPSCTPAERHTAIKLSLTRASELVKLVY